jgi:hypothetical protein
MAAPLVERIKLAIVEELDLHTVAIVLFGTLLSSIAGCTDKVRHLDLSKSLPLLLGFALAMPAWRTLFAAAFPGGPPFRPVHRLPYLFVNLLAAITISGLIVVPVHLIAKRIVPRIHMFSTAQLHTRQALTTFDSIQSHSY